MLASLLVAAPAIADISQPTVDVDPEDISTAGAEYVITFDVNDEVPNDGTGWIEVRFPEDTEVDDTALALGDITVQSTAGFGTLNGVTNIPAADVLVTEDDDIYTVNIDVDILTNPIGEGARVRVTFIDTTTATGNGNEVVLNPSSPGTYTLEVQTSEEDDWVESVPYDIEAPEPDPLPGVVSRYNAADILMQNYTGDTAIQDALNDAGDDNTIWVGPGTYDDNIAWPAFDLNDITIRSSGDTAETIIVGSLTIDGDDNVVDGLLIDGTVIVAASAEDALVENCIFEEDDAGTLTAYFQNSGLDTVVDSCSFAAIGDKAGTGVEALAQDVEVTDSTFEVEDTGLAVDVNGGDLTLDGVTVTGDAGEGNGVLVQSNDVDIESSTFDALDTAVQIDGAGTTTLDGNLIQMSDGEAVDIGFADGPGQAILVNNNFLDNLDDAILIANDATADQVFLFFNSFSGNDVDIDNNDTTSPDLDATNNYWGTPAGPDDDLLEGDIETEPWLGAPAANGEIATGDAELDSEDTAGVVVTVDSGSSGTDPEVIAGAMYPSNPQSVTPAPAQDFFDVFIVDADDDAEEVNIRFFGDVTANTKVYAFGELQGDWLLVSVVDPDDPAAQGVSSFGGYAWARIDDGTVPAIEDLTGTVFALLEEVTAATFEVELITPAVGAEDVSLSPIFTWTEPEDALSYEFEIADESSFDILFYSASSDLAAHKAREELDYNTTYYWRVRAVTGSALTDRGPYETGIFTTMSEPAPEAPPIVIEEQPPAPAPEIILNVPPTQVEVPAPVQAIPDYLLWVIIAVGGVLVIALIVLIVRTRRVA
jgi:hypothetical protein